MASAKFHMDFRKYHRWLGFFLAGIMAVYSISGILLIFRPTDLLKYEQQKVVEIEPLLSASDAISQIKMRRLTVTSESDTEIVFNRGVYDKQTGIATMTITDYHPVLSKMVKLHKATNNSPLFWLNIFFGVGLLFFVISAFLMFLPKLPIYKNGLKIAGLGGLVTVLVVLFGS